MKQLLLSAWFLLAVSPAWAAGALHTLTPCRIVATPSALTLATTYTFSACLADSSSQGGQAIDCGVPSTAAAIMVRVVAAEPQGSGYVRAWPHGGTEPAVAVVLNYFKAADVVDSVYTPAPGALALIALGTSCQIDFEEYYRAAKLILDVEGYVD